MTTATTRRHATVTVRCDCGDVFEISTRSFRRHRAQKTKWRCALCRRLTADLGDLARHHNYWLDRYSLDWIKTTAQMIWGT